MAALLVSLGIMTILMSVVLPVWRHEAQREKESELVFRGQQYARAVNLYTRKAGPGNFPPSVDILVQQRFLRKKYKDPMTKDGEFEIITAAGAQQAQTPQLGQGVRSNAPTTGLSAPGGNLGRGGSRIGGPNIGGQNIGGQNNGVSPFAGSQPGGAGGGIMGVRSKSKDTSIRLYNGATHYNEWSFLFSNVSNRPGVPGGQGPGMNPGGQNRPGFPGQGGGTGPGGRGVGGGPGGPGGPGRSNVPSPFQPPGSRPRGAR
jgi:type II secretory pathway pseudopilin PulG